MKIAFRLLLAGLTLIATLLTACSTISSRQTLNFPFPPEMHHEDVWGRDPVLVDGALEKRLVADPRNEAVRVLVRYQQAKLWAAKDAGKSCALWQDVLKQPRFPLLHIARIRSLESCPLNEGPSIAETVESTNEPWLQDLLLRSSLARARKLGDKLWEMKISLRLAPIENLQSEKVARYSRALALAQELKDEATAATAARELEAIAPRFIANPKPDQLLAVANDFKQVREFDKAREWYQRITDSEEASDWEKLKALDGIRMSFKLEKKIEAYLKATHAYSDFAKEKFLKSGLKMSKQSKESARPLLNQYFQTRLTLARAVWTDDSPRMAEQLLSETERSLEGKLGTEEAALIRARIEEEAGRFNNTYKILAKIEPKQIASSDLRSKILWYRAWSLRKSKKLKQAVTELEALVTSNDEGVGLAARNRFWLGKTLKDLGQTEKAQAQFEWLIENDSMGWYGLLSYRELGRLIPPLVPQGTFDQVAVRSPASATATEPATEPALMQDELLTLEWLISTGELDLARTFLDTVTVDRRAGYSDAQSLDLLRLYARAGQYQTLFNRLYELPGGTRKRLLDAHPDLLFPQPWPALVKTASSRFDVQSELIYSIMRQESAFNSTARSHADAFGLMQLIPESAKRAEASTGIALRNHEELYRPETNIPLGSAFLRSLFDHWNGRYILAVASYNANEKAIEGWLKTRYRGDALEFIEDIPYEETRNYVKLVTRNLIFYKRLNSGAAPVEFPEWCLASLHTVKP